MEKYSICKVCNASILKQKVVRERSDGRPVYQDHTGRLWVGATCSTCFRTPLVNKVKAKAKRKRKCRDCSRPLPPTRYFRCTYCFNGESGELDLHDVYGSFNLAERSDYLHRV